jgi:hypothetical protein
LHQQVRQAKAAAYDLDTRCEAPEAIRYLRDGHARGKIAIIVRANAH